MSLISMHGAWLSFSDAPLLDDTELHIEDNERVCLVGRNGAGKSTLMKILNRELGLDDGQFLLELGRLLQDVLAERQPTVEQPAGDDQRQDEPASLRELGDVEDRGPAE